MGKLARMLSEYGLSAPESETPEERFERERLKKRIREEAGPVRTFKAVEELVPEKGRRGTMGVSIRKHGMYLLAAVTRHLDISQPRMRMTMDWINKMMIIEFDPKGPWKVTFHSNAPGSRYPIGKFGSKAVRDRLAEEGIGHGTYHAEVLDGGKRVVVDFNKRVG